MAAGPADYSSAPRPFSHFPGVGGDGGTAANLWVATASTGASWVDEVHGAEPVEKRLEELRRKFHRGRVLQVKHLPREVTEEEVRELLADWDVQSVLLQAGGARVTLCNPECLEDWDKNAVFNVRGQRVAISPSPTEMLLCVGRIPLSYTESQFASLVSNYGEVRRVFLMLSERTGENKGYGFVEYVTKEAALQAKNALDGRRILDSVAVCDWLDSSHVTVRSLHSKCLYVDRLPPNYRDMGEFRRVFSAVVNPPYCQIALKNGCPQDWGLVEFIREEDAEKTQQSLDGYSLHGSHIRVAYYIPGVRAINLYLKLLNDGGSNKGKSALLPDPPAPAVFQQLQSLAKQNPVFAQNLQTIIMQQISDLQKGKDPKGGRGGGGGGGGQSSLGRPPFPPPQSPGGSGQQAMLKNAQQTALSILLGGGAGNQHQILQALQAVTGGQGGGQQLGQDFFNNGGGGSNQDPFYSPNLLSPSGSSEGDWGSSSGSSFKGRSTPQLFQNHKSPLLPEPMETGMKTPPGGGVGGDSFQAVWYSLFGQGGANNSSSGDNSPGSSPLFGSGGSPIGRSADALFGNHAQSNSYQQQHQQQQQQQPKIPPGFGHGGGGHGEGIQEALNTLIGGGLGGFLDNPGSNNFPQQRGQRGGDQALLDLLMASMKEADGWGVSGPPSPVGHGRNYSGENEIFGGSGNGGASPTPMSTWMLGGNIWGAPGANSLNSGKRKGGGEEMGLLGSNLNLVAPPPPSLSPPQGERMSHYADSYYKKKKKN